MKIGDVYLIDGEPEVIVKIEGRIVETDLLFERGCPSGSHIGWIEKQQKLSQAEVDQLKAERL